jgi:hypothetical protein
VIAGCPVNIAIISTATVSADLNAGFIRTSAKARVYFTL